jgi:hypothetical protein
MLRLGNTWLKEEKMNQNLFNVLSSLGLIPLDDDMVCIKEAIAKDTLQAEKEGYITVLVPIGSQIIPPVKNEIKELQPIDLIMKSGWINISPLLGTGQCKHCGK